MLPTKCALCTHITRSDRASHRYIATRTAELLSRDAALQAYVGEMLDDGVVIEACRSCADLYGVSDALSSLGIDVKYMGVPLTTLLKDGSSILTF